MSELVNTHAQTGRISAGNFWRRRRPIALLACVYGADQAKACG